MRERTFALDATHVWFRYVKVATVEELEAVPAEQLRRWYFDLGSDVPYR